MNFKQHLQPAINSLQYTRSRTFHLHVFKVSDAGMLHGSQGSPGMFANLNNEISMRQGKWGHMPPWVSGSQPVGLNTFEIEQVLSQGSVDKTVRKLRCLRYDSQQ